MKAYVKNLRDEVFAGHRDRRIAACPVCGSEYSAHSGDYFMAGPNDAISCCGVVCDIVVPYSGYHAVAR